MNYQLLPIITILVIAFAGCGHMNDMLMGAAAGGAAGMGNPVYYSEQPVTRPSAFNDPSWDAIGIQAAIGAQTEAINNAAAATAGY